VGRAGRGETPSIPAIASTTEPADERDPSSHEFLAWRDSAFVHYPRTVPGESQPVAAADPSSNLTRPEVHRLSTGAIAAGDRFDFWRSLFSSSVEMRRAGKTDRPFRGELTQLRGRGGLHFNHLRCDALENRYCASPSEGAFLLTLVIRGRVELSDDAGASILATGGLFLTDSSRRARVRHSDYSMGYLKLPREWVLERLGGDPLPARSGLARLSQEPLAPFLSSQLSLLCARGDQLEDPAREAALQAARDLGLAMLRRRVETKPSEQELSDRGLFAAAQLYIERRLHAPDLTPAEIAAGVGCSRARLYRLFAQHERVLFEFVREARLQRSRQLLQSPDAPEITAIAFDCGFTELSTFNRAFKRRFGVTPSEWRETDGQATSRRRA
jgi:AraC-like DNA-binding protein